MIDKTRECGSDRSCKFWGSISMEAVKVTAKSEPARAQRRTRGLQADLSCLMCGRMVGHIIDKRVVHRTGCTGQIKLISGMLRCCQCSGTLYREPVSPLMGH